MREVIPQSKIPSESDKAMELYFHHYLGNRPIVININPSQRSGE